MMQRNAPPPYKPPPEIQAEIEKQILTQKQNQQARSAKRHTTAVLPKRNWIYRNPKLFQIAFLTTGLLILFSKPLYDAFLSDPLPPTKRIPAHKR